MKRKPSPSSKSSSAKPARAASGARTKAAAATKPAAKRAKPALAQAPEVTTTKQSQLITLLRSEAGVSMEQMMALTGWQSHTVRGMLSGSLRKRLGLDVQCQRVDGVHLYRIVEAAAA
ncbi:DUF3489 domain-containing protein [Hydrogenophaga pseudoflava]|uniref:DUF3489 domain-containing protein n=1 Tax=Hydrogenophaga pseudoflava TaxID=47421 RepID=UPI0027E3E1FA|nr:DUF3489 domain-containing protein [Hydrogenophaga pseudoflava]MDQ7747388.1 DUF3489 domain-containing protein [Hydrogenophaga pseudoflava]